MNKPQEQYCTKFSFSIPIALAEELERRCEQEGVLRSRLIKRALQQYLTGENTAEYRLAQIRCLLEDTNKD